MKTCKCGKALSPTNVTGLCKDCFLKAHPEVKPRTFSKEVKKVAENIGKSLQEGMKQMEKSLGNLEINPSLAKQMNSPYNTYREIQEQRFNPEIAKAQEIKQSAIAKSVALEQSREATQFLVGRTKEVISIDEFIEIQKEIYNKYLEILK